ncbi:leucine-rich repeat protein [Lachnospiraceae bacterium 62-26]
MKNKHVIALLATASLIVSVPVTSMAGDTLGVSFQTAVSDSEGGEQNSEDTASTGSVSKSLSGSDTDAVISDMDSKVSDNPCTTPDTDAGTSDLPYATPDTSISDDKSSVEISPDGTSILQSPSTDSTETNSEPSEPLGNELVSPYAGEEDFILSGTTLTSYTGTDEEVIVPEGVTRIGRDAFKDNTAIRRVVLPESCDYLQYAIFATCTSLEEVVINCKTVTFSTTNIFGSNNVTVYGYPYSEVPAYCAKYGGITFIAMEQPESEKFTIDAGGKLTRYWGTDEAVTVPEGVTAVSAKAFLDNTSTKKVILPSTCTTVSAGAFTRCSALEEIELLSRSTSFASGAIITPTPSGTIEVTGYLYSQPSYYCDSYAYLTFTAKDTQSGNLTEITAEPEKLMDGEKELKLYRVTVKDIIHGYKDDLTVIRNIYVPDLDRYCTQMAVDGSAFSFSANEEILNDSRGYVLVSDKTVEGIVNGRDVEVSFHYTFKGDTIRYQQEEEDVTKQCYTYCDISVDKGLNSLFNSNYYLVYNQSSVSSAHKGRVNALRYTYGSDGTLKSQTTMTSTQSGNIYIQNGHAKVQTVTGASTIYQNIPILFGKAGLQESLVLDEGGEIVDVYGNHYRVAYNVDENSGEDKFTLKGSSSTTAKTGNFTIRLKPVDGYTARPEPEFEIKAEGSLASWGYQFEMKNVDSFVENPVTGEPVETPGGVLLSITISQPMLWEEVVDDIRSKGSTMIDAGFYRKEGGGIVFVPLDTPLENRRYPMEYRMLQLRGIAKGQSFMANNNESVVIGIKNERSYCTYDKASYQWSNDHEPETGELCKGSDGRVYVCQYPVGTEPGTWGYIEVTADMLSVLEKLLQDQS